MAFSLRHGLAVYAAVNAVLYAALLPLWEGFDEPFHFAYVQQLANGWGLPDARSARLSEEVRTSIADAPASASVKRNLPTAVSYAEFFSWTSERRAAGREQLARIPPQLRWSPAGNPNYEAQQAPLAYALLAVPERFLAGMPLLSRVLALRIAAGLAGALLLYTGVEALCAALGLPLPYADAVLFCALSSQMTWATIAHVSNDWLALPLAVWTLALALRCAATPTRANRIFLALVFAAGLLTKAYFLALAPLVLLVCAWHSVKAAIWPALAVTAIAGPWHLRNRILYGTITGMQEFRGGIQASTVLARGWRLPWHRIARDSARAALWTGNNTFRTFSTATLNVILLVWVAALILWVFSRHTRADSVAAIYCGLFAAALAFAGALADVSTGGASSTPAPWYSQVLVAPLLALAMLGAARHASVGRILAAALSLLFGYVLAATYIFRLIPLYSGFAGRCSVASVAALYLTRAGELRERLASAVLGPVWLIFAFAATTVGTVIILEIGLIRQLLRANLSTPAPPPAPALPLRKTRCAPPAALPVPARPR